jgi:putative DNA-invertase from lambdoid prophage Rac
MPVYGYCRVSTDRQADEGESLGAQQRQIKGYAMMLGQGLPKIFVERGVSGSKPFDGRPEGAKLMAVLQPGDVVITPKLDRMFRSALDALGILAHLQKSGVSLHMIDLGGDVTGNGISKLVFTILSAVAEAERDRIRERIREVKSDQKKRGRYLGGIIPFGWVMRDGQLHEERKQQAAITKMREMRAAGHSLRSIEAAMREQGVKLSHQGIANILANPSSVAP